MFRGKESSNRIELSRLVQDLLNFGVLGSLQLWGGGRWVVGDGSVPTHMHMHTHTQKIANGHQHVYHDSGVFPVFPMSSPSSPCHPCHPHIIRVIPIFPMSSPSSPCHPCHPHIIHVIPTSSPEPPPRGDHPESVKSQ